MGISLLSSHFLSIPPTFTQFNPIKYAVKKVSISYRSQTCMATAASKSLQVDVPIRPHAHYPKDIWGDRFDNFILQDKLRMEKYAEEVEGLKEEVLMMLKDKSSHLANKMRLIDQVERLGFPYYYENEINELIDQMFQQLKTHNFMMDFTLYDTALQFRIFRQHGYNMPCDVFKKFTNGEGKFKESLKSDEKGMISLYEATFLRLHNEDILEEALVFTTDFLKSIATTSKQGRLALKQPLQRGGQRLQARRFISLYEEDESHNEKLLRLAKIEFNRLQLSHRQELSQAQKWWKKFELEKKLPYVRHRIVECHFIGTIVYYEPQYSLARLLFTKFYMYLTVIDDTYDAYGTFDELLPLTDAFHKWDLNVMEQFPEEYMKVVYEFVINVCNEFAEETNKLGKPFAGHFIKEQVLELIRNYLIEVTWVKTKYVPTYEEYMVNGRVTAGIRTAMTGVLMGMNDVLDEKPFAQLLQTPSPKAIEAGNVISRLMDDIATHEAELSRGCRLASSVECYMKDNDKSKEEVLQIFSKKIDDAWKDLAQEGLHINPNPNDYDHFSKPTYYNRILNLARCVEVLYKDADGYSNPENTIKEDILATFSQPFSL